MCFLKKKSKYCLIPTVFFIVLQYAYVIWVGTFLVCVSLLFAIGACKYYDFPSQVQCFYENLANSLKQAYSICLKALELSRAKMFYGEYPLTRKFLVLMLLQCVLTSFSNSA